jgi:lipopolysaccharide transport system ATP-binding protein
MSDDVLIKVDSVSKKFCRSLKHSLWYGVKDVAGEMFGHQGDYDDLRPEEFWAVNDVSFELKRGECLGLIGRNGAGKTTLLRMLNGLIKPDKGQIETHGRVGALIALGAGFNPILTGRENIYVNASVLGLSKKETDGKLEGIIEFAEIEEFIDSPVQIYSSGMQVRLGFAVATALEPDILIIDEVLAVGDSKFRAKCYNRLVTILSRAAVILVSHQMHDIARVCNQGLLLKKGQLIAAGQIQNVIAAYNVENDLGLGEKHAGSMKVSVSRYSVSPNVNATGYVGLKIKLLLSADFKVESVEIVFSVKDSEGRIVLQCPYVTAIYSGLTDLTLFYESLPLGAERFSYDLVARCFDSQEVFHLIENAGAFTVKGSKRYVSSLIAEPSTVEVFHPLGKKQ